MRFIDILFIVVVVIIVIRIKKKYKPVPVGCVTLINGGVKKGKSLLSVDLAIKQHNRDVKKWKKRCFWCKLFRKDLPEKPLLYSNIPLDVPYVPLTLDMLLLKERQSVYAVTILDDASLIADSYLIKNDYINRALCAYTKLYGHATLGGKLFITTHNITDLHFALKRCVSDYIYIVDSHPFLWWQVLDYRLERYADDGTSVNVYTDSVDTDIRHCLVSRKKFKIYDSCCYYGNFEKLPFNSSEIIPDTLQRDDIVSFRDYNSIFGGDNK